ncbi:hypothetical protein BDV3_005932 [Batrachochytrium dendrobatidis]
MQGLGYADTTLLENKVAVIQQPVAHDGFLEDMAIDKIDSCPLYSDDDDDFEQSSLTVPIPSHNKGFKLLLKMGWKQGTGLGIGGSGRLEPVPIGNKGDTLGLGKAEQMQLLHSASTSRHKISTTEKIATETEQAKLEREAKVLKMELIKEEIKTAQSAFYCALCDKQYTKISEYETHLSSYDHNHRKRFKEMQELSKRSGLLGQRKTNKEDKESIREQREINRLQQAMMHRAESNPLKPIPCVDMDANQPCDSKNNIILDSNQHQDTEPVQNQSKKPIAFGFGSKKPVGSIKFSLNKK